MYSSEELSAQIEPFDSFWEGPENVEKGYGKFRAFYRYNYLKQLPADRDSNILVISCGPGYFVNMLATEGYRQVTGIDSRRDQIEWAERHGLNCKVARAFEYLQALPDAGLDAIVCEQEVNHLDKREILAFLPLCYSKLKPGGTLVCHALNGANPVVGAEALAQNFDHYNTFTEYTMRQVLEHSGFTDTRVFELNLYVFWKNPANYVLLAAVGALHLLFRALFVMYGKSNRLFTKKIGAACVRPA